MLLSWEFDDFAFLENFAVHKKYRNNGLGSVCLKKVKEYYKVEILEIPKHITKINAEQFYKCTSIKFIYNFLSIFLGFLIS